MDAWNYVLRPTLADFRGDAYFLSTPKGHNGFWQMWQLGQQAEQTEWASWQMPSTVGIVPASEFESMRLSMPEKIYAQEILAQFIADAGGVFRRVMDSATAAEQKPQAGHEYVMGVDWGKHNDFTVLTVLDVATRQMVAMDRFNQIDYSVQMGRLSALNSKYKPISIIAETNSMGDVLVEQMIRLGLPVQGFQTTNATKAAIIDGLSIAFERGEISIINDTTLVGELQAFEMERLPSGLLRYSAPPGIHDDCVMSLALAWFGLSRPSAASLVDFA
jgi:hypothetical protein